MAGIDPAFLQNPRLEGWCQPLESGEDERTFQLVIGYTDGSGRRILDLIVITGDGLQRAQVAQFLQSGKLAGCTAIARPAPPAPSITTR